MLVSLLIKLYNIVCISLFCFCFYCKKIFLMVNLVFPIVLPTTAVDSMLLVVQKIKMSAKRVVGISIY